MYKWMIFDLDGTLVNSISDIRNAINITFNNNNLDAKYTDDDCIKFIGSGARVLIKRALEKFSNDDLLLEKLLKEYNEYYNKHSLIITKPFDGAVETLEYLKSNNIKLGVLSNKPDVDTKNIVKHFFNDIFDVVQGQVSYLKTKPDPEGINYICKEFNIKKEELLYVGDMSNDMEVSINSNIDFCLCDFGYGKYQKLDKYKYKINKFSDLKNII